MYYTLSKSYEEKKISLENYRIAYVEIVINKRGGYLDGDFICYKTDETHCIQTK